MEILRVDKLYKIYGKNATNVRALDDVSLSLEPGEFANNACFNYFYQRRWIFILYQL